MVRFRRSMKLGPLRLTATTRGFSVSGGVPGARITANSRGEVRRTLSIPGAGIWDTKLVNPKRRKTEVASPTPEDPDGDGTATIEFADATARERAEAALAQPAPAPEPARGFTVGQAVVTVLLLVVIGLLAANLITR